METITFYNTEGIYGSFLNFSAAPISLLGKIWPNTEHYFQAQKFPGTDYEEKIRHAKSPMIAARLGRSRKHPLRGDWEQVKEDIMRAALYAKFTQRRELTAQLLGTDDAELVEHTKNDSHWGDGGDGSGKNRLGVLLMELREKLRQEGKEGVS